MLSGVGLCARTDAQRFQPLAHARLALSGSSRSHAQSAAPTAYMAGHRLCLSAFVSAAVGPSVSSVPLSWRRWRRLRGTQMQLRSSSGQRRSNAASQKCPPSKQKPSSTS
eukprot:15439505-Alexandrium_andersonii.AAC.1